MPDMSPFASRLTEARLAIPVSMDMLGDAVGVTKAAIGNYEMQAGRTPSFAVAARIARALSMPDRVRDFHMIRRSEDKRSDIRSEGPGTTGYYDRDRIKRVAPITPAVAKLSVAKFVGSLMSRIEERQLSLSSLAVLADVYDSHLIGLFDKLHHNSGLKLCANIAEVLGFNGRLADFADSSVRPIQPLE